MRYYVSDYCTFGRDFHYGLHGYIPLVRAGSSDNLHRIWFEHGAAKPRYRELFAIYCAEYLRIHDVQDIISNNGTHPKRRARSEHSNKQNHACVSLFLPRIYRSNPSFEGWNFQTSKLRPLFELLCPWNHFPCNWSVKSLVHSHSDDSLCKSVKHLHRFCSRENEWSAHFKSKILQVLLPDSFWTWIDLFAHAASILLSAVSA